MKRASERKITGMRRLILPSVFVLLMAAAALAEDVAIVFTRPGCPPCERLKAAMAGDPSLFAGYRLQQVDTSQDREMAAKYGVRSVPTIVVVRSGKQIKRRTGYESADELREWLDGAKKVKRGRWR